MKKVKKNNKLFKVLYVLITSILLVFLGMMLKYVDIVPTKYIVILISFLGVLSIILGIFIFKFNNLFIKILSGLYIFIIIGINFIVLLLSLRAYNVIEVLTNNKYQTVGYSVIVLKDSSSNILDYDNGKFGTLEKNDEVSDNLNEKVDVKLLELSNLAQLVDSLYSGNIKAAVIEDSYLDVMEESDTSVLDNIKVIYKFDILVKEEDIKKSVDVSLEPFTILISGIDTSGSIKTRSRSDVNIIMAINPKTYEIALVHIPRDYYVEFDGLGTKDKLTHSGIYGIDMTVGTIENLMDIDINYYVRINFSTFIKLIDLIGDIEVNNPVAFTSYGTHYDSGNIILNSKEALLYARTRKVLKGGDRARGMNQERVLAGIINKMSAPGITKNAYDILDVMSDSFVTNFSSNEIRSLINFELNYLPKWKVNSYSLTGNDMSTKGTPFYPNKALYVMKPDNKSIEDAKEAIKAVIGPEKE